MMYVLFLFSIAFLIAQRRIEQALDATWYCSVSPHLRKRRWLRISLKTAFLAGSFFIALHSQFPFSLAIPFLVACAIIFSLRGLNASALQKEMLAAKYFGPRSPECKVVIAARQAPALVVIMLLLATDATSLIYDFSIHEITNPVEAAICYFVSVTIPVVILAALGYFVNRHFYQRTLVRIEEIEGGDISA